MKKENDYKIEKTLTIIAYYDNNLLTGKILDNSFSDVRLKNIIELNQVKDFLEDNTYITGESFLNMSLSDLREKVIPKEKNTDASLLFYKDNAWFSGFFRSDIEGRVLKDYMNYESPLADFYGWSISNKSKFKRSESRADIFNNSKSFDKYISWQIESSYLIKTANTWGFSKDNELVKHICNYFDKNSIYKEDSKYFYIYKWNENTNIFDSFDPEEPARKDNFNPNDTLVFNNEIVFEFYKMYKHDEKWNVYEAAMSDEYQDIVNIGEEYDPAFYTVTCLNNFIEYLKTGIFEPRLYLNNC